MRYLIAAVGLIFYLPAIAATYVPTASVAPAVSFDIAYTAGVHRGTSTLVTGSLVLDNANRLVKGLLSVPLTSLKTRNETRDCHLREAMGIDYTHSAFPAQHVCDARNQTPVTGPDSVVFPNIEFEFTDLVQTSGEALPSPLVVATTYTVFLRGKFSLHGQTRLLDGGQPNATLVGKLTAEASDRIRIQSAFPVVLQDYAIVVKPSKLGPVTISVANQATVSLNLLLTQQN